MSSRSKQVIDKYLLNYAEAESRHPIALDGHRFSYCLVIPAYQESYLELQKVWRALSNDILIIVVANAASSQDPLTKKMISDIKNQSQIQHSLGKISYLIDNEGFSILLVDRCQDPIAKKQGVGLARKIGADIALSLINTGAVSSPWIFNTDADVRLPADYFLEIPRLTQQSSTTEISALIYPFVHHPAKGTEQACQLYEISLLYYVAGLKYAASNYAFNTIGSTIAINAASYAKVRGFPVRSAGEDFYLLNKLEKTGHIYPLHKPVIEISGRLSERVPFGTGVGIKKILDFNKPLEDTLFYHPKIFQLLGQLLKRLATSHGANDLHQHFSNDDPAIQLWCKQNKLYSLIASKQGQKAEVFDKFIHDWMDGFKTLKFIHFMRDKLYPSVPLRQILKAEFLSIPGNQNLIDLPRLRQFLQSSISA